jgi:hypothetical protein
MDKAFNSLVRRSRVGLHRAEELLRQGKWLDAAEMQHLYRCMLIVCGNLFRKVKSEKFKLSKKDAFKYQSHLIVLFFLETISQRKQIASYLTLEVNYFIFNFFLFVFRMILYVGIMNTNVIFLCHCMKKLFVLNHQMV